MIEVLYAPTDHGRSVHVTICRSSTGRRDDLTRFVVSQDAWLELKFAFGKGAYMSKNDHYARLDEGMFA